MASLVDSCAPVLRALENAPTDDEPVGEAEALAVREAFEDVARGDLHSTDQVRLMLGL